MSKNTLKVNELRVGNWVFDSDGFEAKIHGIKPFEHSCRCDEEEGCLLCMDIYPPDGTIRKEYVDSLLDCSPIPITHERLLGFGFREISKTEFMSSYENTKYPSIGYRIPKIKDYHASGFVFRGIGIENIKYVHQLQNLCLDLTEEAIQLSPVEYA